MSAIQNFVQSSVPAIDEFLLKMTDEERGLVHGLVGAGYALVISLVVQPDVLGKVLLEAVGPDGERRSIAHVYGVRPTIQ